MVKGGKLSEGFFGPHTIINVLPHGVYEIRNEGGKTAHATGRHLKMYKSLKMKIKVLHKEIV